MDSIVFYIEKKIYPCLLLCLQLHNCFISEFIFMLQDEQRNTWDTVLTGATHGKRLYQCSICHKKYSSKGALQRHVRYECGVEPQFRCHLCNRRFCHNYHLKTHLILHERRSGFQ